MDTIAKSEIMFAYFMCLFFPGETTQVYVSEKKHAQGKHEPWNGRGTTMERPSNAVEMQKKKQKA